MNKEYKLKHEHKAALAAIDSNGSLSAALEALKDKLGKKILATEPQELKKREDFYTQYRMIGELKEVIKAAINDAGDVN